MLILCFQYFNKQITQNTRFVNQLRMCKYYVHTGNLESFHSLQLMYAPKRIGYSYVGIELRSILAVLDNNHNLGREKSGKQKVKYSKATKQFSLVDVPTAKDNKWCKDLVLQAVECVKDKSLYPFNPDISEVLFPFDLPSSVSAVSRPSREELAEKKRYRQ